MHYGQQISITRLPGAPGADCGSAHPAIPASVSFLLLSCCCHISSRPSSLLLCRRRAVRSPFQAHTPAPVRLDRLFCRMCGQEDAGSTPAVCDPDHIKDILWRRDGCFAVDGFIRIRRRQYCVWVQRSADQICLPDIQVRETKVKSLSSVVLCRGKSESVYPPRNDII